MPRDMEDPDNYITRRLAQQRVTQTAPQSPLPIVSTQPVGSPESLGGLPNPSRNTGVAGGVDRGMPQQSPQGSTAGRVPGQEGYNFGGDATGYTSPDMNKPNGGGANDLAWRKSLSYGSGPGTLSGFNTSGAGYDDKAANSVKNTFGRLAQRYPATPEGLKQLMNDPDFKRAFPNASLVPGGAGDKIDFGGVRSDFESGSPVGIIDVGQAFDPRNNSGQAWWWGSEPDGGQGTVTGTGSARGGSSLNLPSILAGQDPLNDIMRRIQDLQAGRTPDAETQALMDMLMGNGGTPNV